MARRKTKAAVKTEEAVEAVEAVEVTEELEVTDEFHLQEVSDTTDSYEDIVEAGLVDLDKTEVEAEIEEGAELEIVEEVVESSEPAKKAKPEARKNRTTVDTRVSAAEILKNQAEKEANDEKRKEKQRMTRVKPVISQEKKNNGIRTSAGLFFR